MKKIIIAMIAMALLIGWPGAGIWVTVFSKILGGGIAEGYLYPIYGGIILLAGLIVGCTVYIVDEIHSLKETLKQEKTS